MTLDVTPETERLVHEEIQRGHFASVDDLIVQAMLAWREKCEKVSSPDISSEARRLAGERIRELRSGVRMERQGITLREYVHLGHHY